MRKLCCLFAAAFAVLLCITWLSHVYPNTFGSLDESLAIEAVLLLLDLMLFSILAYFVHRRIRQIRNDDFISVVHILERATWLCAGIFILVAICIFYMAAIVVEVFAIFDYDRLILEGSPHTNAYTLSALACLCWTHHILKSSTIPAQTSEFSRYLRKVVVIYPAILACITLVVDVTTSWWSINHTDLYNNIYEGNMLLADHEGNLDTRRACFWMFVSFLTYFLTGYAFLHFFRWPRDMHYESIWQLLVKNPLFCALLAFWSYQIVANLVNTYISNPLVRVDQVVPVPTNLVRDGVIFMNFYSSFIPTIIFTLLWHHCILWFCLSPEAKSRYPSFYKKLGFKQLQYPDDITDERA